MGSKPRSNYLIFAGASFDVPYADRFFRTDEAHSRIVLLLI